MTQLEDHMTDFYVLGHIWVMTKLKVVTMT